jgi:hypothetical protein
MAKQPWEIIEDDEVQVIDGERVGETGKVYFIAPAKEDFPITLYCVRFPDGTDFPYDITQIQSVR